MSDTEKAADEIMRRLAATRRMSAAGLDRCRNHVQLALNSFALLALASPRAAELVWDYVGTELEKAHDPA